jgi:hypothetical protein
MINSNNGLHSPSIPVENEKAPPKVFEETLFSNNLNDVS